MTWLLLPPLRPFVLLAALASLVLNLALLMPSIYMVQVFDRVFTSRSLETLLLLSGLTLLALALGYAMDTARARALASAGGWLEKLLAPAALSSLLRQAAGRSDSVRDDAMRDIARLRGLLAGTGMQALFDAPWLPVYLAVIGLMHPLLGLAAACGAALLGVLAWLTERLTRQATDRSLALGRAASHHAEALRRNAEVIVGMGMTQAAIAGWERRQQQASDAQRRLGRRSARLAAGARSLRQGLQIGMLALGAWLVLREHASPGIMMAATILLGRALQPVELLISGWKQQVEARGAWQRLEKLSFAAPADGALALPAPLGRLEVERLHYSPAPGRPALIKGLNFSIAAGESVGLIGPSASGKTTLVRLLLGIRQPSAGTVRLDGADIAQCDRDALGLHLGYLPQDVELFAGSVAENIARLAAVPDSAAVIEAARMAQVHEMVLRLPQGYDTQIGDGGAVLSGGQRQRIGLARALYGRPRLVVLDEPNANLDAEGAAALAAAIGALKARGVTVILVGHRPALMARLDKLAVLKDGVLEVFGPSAAVLARLRPVAVGHAAPAAAQALRAGATT